MGQSKLNQLQRFDCLLDDPDCAIYFTGDRNAEQVIVSFTGVGHAMGGVDVQKPEFMSAAKFGAVCFVVDKNRTWGNHLTFDLIVSTIRAHIGEAIVKTIGNSMGGFLAILMSEPLNAERAIAFSPQWSIDPKIVPDEKRWLNYRAEIRDIIYPDLSKAWSPDCEYLAIFGDDADENIHYPFFARTPNCKVLQFADADHNIAAHLKSKNLLFPIMTDWLEQGQVSALIVPEDLVS